MSNIGKWLLLGLLGASVSSYATDDEQSMFVSDGPYIKKQEGELTVECVINSQAKRYQGLSFIARMQIDNCGYPVTLSNIDFIEKTTLTFNTKQRIVATSDFHGQYAIMKRLLQRNGVIDSGNNWALGKGHFVITGDIFDRGDKVTEILWFIYQLEQQAKAAGGYVHLLLGNHEVMVLNGDLRYLHPKYLDVARILDSPFELLFDKNTVLGDWLRSKPVLVKINNMLFAHGGFHPELVEKQLTLASINTSFKKNLIKRELPESRSELGEFLHKKKGPVWYRGLLKDNGATSAEIDLLLKHFDVKHLVIGHTSQKEVLTKHQGRVIAIDSSIKRGQYGEVLIVDGDKKWRGTLDGKQLPLENHE
ncbi:metallophosphoesterase [Thalassotalea sp. 1_MG-2023]|uniref:metallophosphoesterase n=1 Tax=Thalassotalea sp. 1_MG-2023 TaxID=3062680 RepID=UPI0026E274F9|nr:metallophosphoesterase [Thalassotalea sp. 1_MG-2023]MDO6428109.1 metallophosphoesterase [Thalassotalea sp. 1_MG-2023]